MTPTPKPYPQPNATLPFWRMEPHDLETHRTTPDLPEQCDVIIIGAGYAGVSTAYHLFENNLSPPKTILLEARQACSGATGRNGGHIRPDIYDDASKRLQRYGIEATAEIVNFEIAHLNVIKNLVYQENIDCDFTLTRNMDVFTDEIELERAKEFYDKMIENGRDFIQDVYYSSKHATGLTGVKDAKGFFSHSAGHLWPYKLVMHLLTRALSKGLNLQTHTLVKKLGNEPEADGRWLVSTDRGTIRAKQVVLASNAYTAGLAPQYSRAIIPCKGICCHIATPKGRVAPHLANSYLLRPEPKAYNYLVPRNDGSIIVGGAQYTLAKVREQWYNNVDDSTLIEEAKSYFDGYMQRTFMGWEDSGAYTAEIWTGIMGYSADSLPHVGDVPGKPGQFILAGFNGHGMPVGFLAAKGLSEMICHSSSYEATGLPRLFQTSHARLESMLDDILDSGGEAGEISTQKSEAAQSRDSPTFDVNAVKII